MTDAGRILVVDDEAPVREVLSDYFVERGYAVFTAADGEEALARETLSIGAFDYVAKPFDFEHLNRMVVTAFVHSDRAPLGAAELAPPPIDPWCRFVADVFRCVRGMEPDGRPSTGVRLEDAALGAAREALAGRLAEAISRLIEIKLLVSVASRLGDLPASARSVVTGALEAAEAALPSR